MTIPRTNAGHDQNWVPTLLGVSSADGETPVPVEVNPLTGGLLIDTTVSIGSVTNDGTFATPVNQATEIARLTSIRDNQTNSNQLTQIVDGSGNVIGTEEIGSQIYLNTAIVQDIEIATTNSSTSNVNAGATFTGTSWSTLGVASVQVSLFADQNCTIIVQQAQQDPGVNWDLIDSWEYTASSGGNDAARTIQATGAAFRVRVTNNGPSATTIFRLQSFATPYADALPRGLSQQGNLKVSLEELNATDISVGNGTSDLGTQRVAIASDNDPIPVMSSSLPLPSGASTSALQTSGNSSLTSIDSKLSGTLTASVTGSVGSASGAVNVNQKAVSTSAVQLNAGSVVPTNGILVGALSTNSAPIFIGGSGVTTTNGAELLPGASFPFTCNLNTLYIISAASTTDRVYWNVA